MKKRYFTDQISKDSLEKMILCFQPQYKTYQPGETILAYSDGLEQIGILLSGSAKLYYIAENGDTSLLENYKDGDLFGEAFSLPLDNYEYIVTASSTCRAVFVEYRHLVTPCQNACQHHSQLISNLFLMAAQKSQELSLHISILNQPTIRKKLLAYLRYSQTACNAHEKEYFEIPFSLGALAEYLAVDRSAMMREIRNLKKDGYLDSSRRRFLLKK
ncbi:Crp/Fnr family transcriptional regulator [Ihubacter sp. rT4E-8]|uniref:Crp/Fnr family transcriptional regulator n=1 Tax=Ihubacter sp. rT4E-8 TaxID=3242369 RepID=UPI003CF41277